jgi:PAS domain S-box-containing protein
MRVYDWQAQQWRYLFEITRAIVARLDLDSVLDRALRYAVELVNGDAGLLALRARDGETFHFAARFGIEPALLPLFEPLLTEIPLAIATDRTPRWRFPELELKFAGIVRTQALRLRYVMAIPLIASERLSGIIYVFRPPRAAAFTLMDENALEGFAEHVALAIEHARLYEDAARRAQELEAVIEGSANGFFITDGAGRLQRMNRALEQLTAWTRQSAQDVSFTEILRWTDERGEPVTPPDFSQAGASSYSSDGYLKRRDGSRGAFVHITLSPQFDEAGRLFSIIGNVVDMTALREANELQTTFLAGISHDLKTPLALIRGYAETLRRPDVNWTRQTLDESLAVIEEEAEHLTQLVNALLDAAQLQRGQLPLQKNWIRVDELARKLVERFQAVHPEYTWQVEFPNDYPAVFADAPRIRQVLQNLLSNAVKYSPRHTTITVGGWSEPQRIGVVVRDQGGGVPPEEQARLFERFTRGRARHAQRSEGAGLGLYLCRAIVEQHGGKIWMENLPERGAAFYFTLPRPEETSDR